MSLKASGYMLLLGDAALFASGMMSGRTREAATGLIWSTAGLAPAIYGKPDPERELKQLNRRLSKYLQAEGVEIPRGAGLTSAELGKEGGIIENIEDFLYKYPSQTLNAIYAVGSLQLIRSGMQHNKPWDTASGALVAAGALGGLLIPEHKKDENEPPPKNLVEKAWSWVKEKPLRVPALFYIANDVTLAKSAFEERRVNPGQKSYYFKFLTVASYVLGNVLLSISSKDSAEHNTADESKAMREKLGLAAAQVIAAQPKELQEALTAHVSGFLAAQPEIKKSATEINAEMKHYLASVTHSHPAPPPAAVAAPASGAIQPKELWQQRIQQPAVQEPPQISV